MILYLIPARGGSKRLPNKNLRKLAGIPLVAHAVRRAQKAARLVGGEHRVVVSTDSEEIARVATGWGAHALIRPACFATDRATTEVVALHAISIYGDVDLVVLLQATTPFACAEDVVSVVAQCRYPNWSNAGAASTWRGQPTGGAYVLTPEHLGAGLKFWGNEGTVHVEQRSRFHVDIDREEDWITVEALMAAGAA